MKDETSGVAVEEFLELKPKMYSSWQMIVMRITKKRGWVKILLQI